MNKAMYLAGAVLAMGAVITPSIVSAHPVYAAEQNVTIPSEEVTGTQAYETLEMIRLMHESVNSYRAENGLEPLDYSYNNAEVAAPYAQRLANSGTLIHESNWWTKPSANVGQPLATGENLAMRGSARNDRVDAASIVSQWKNSPTHNENLLRPQFDSVGYGVVRQGSQVFVVQRFTGYDNNENRYPEHFYLYDSPTELPSFGQVSDISFSGDSRMGETLSIDGFDRGSFSHPARVDTTDIRWYIEGAGRTYVETNWEILLRGEPEALEDMVGLGNSTFTIPQDPAFAGKKVRVEIRQQSAWTDETFSHTFGPFDVQDVFLKNTVAPKVSGLPTVGQTLSVDDGSWNRTPETVKYQWLRNGSPISGATSKDYKLVSADAGADVSVRVSAAYQGDNPVSVTTDTVNVVSDEGPGIVGTPSITSTGNQPGAKLTANIAWDDSTARTSYQWLRDGSPISGATGKTYTLTNDDVQKKISVRFTGTVGQTETTHTTQFSKTVDAPPVKATENPLVTGIPTKDSTLTVSEGKYNQDITNVTYQWYRDGSPIQGATSKDYKVTDADMGRYVTAEVTVTGRWDNTLSTTASGFIGEEDLSFNIQVIGEYKQGQPVEVRVSATPQVRNLSYQWNVDGKPIAGATSHTLMLNTYAGRNISVTVSGTTAGGQKFTVTTREKTVESRFTVHPEIVKKHADNADLLGAPTRNPTNLRNGGIVQHFEGGYVYWSPSTEASIITDGAIKTAWKDNGWENGGLGYPTSDEKKNLRNGGAVQFFENGAITWTSAHKAHIIMDDNYKLWESQGGVDGTLGYPTSGETNTFYRDGTTQNFEKGTIYWNDTTGSRIVKNAIKNRYVDLGAERSYLKYPTSNEMSLRNGGFYQKFQGGNIYWSSATGAHPTSNSVHGAWSRVGYENGDLGYPTSSLLTFKYDKAAQYQNFQGGMIIVGKPGSYHVKGAILSQWKSLGWERSAAGLPTSDPRPLANGGMYQKFQGGSIHWSPKSGAFFTKNGSPIQRAWGNQKYENGALGYPTSNERTLKGGTSQSFQGGQVHWSSKTGAHITKGAIQRTWGNSGWENGKLGYPTSDERGLKNGGAYQKFQGGSIHWSSKSGAHITTGAIQKAWGKQGYENGRLGYPTSNEYKSGGKTWQNYQGGKISWTSREGARVQYN